MSVNDEERSAEVPQAKRYDELRIADFLAHIMCDLNLVANALLLGAGMGAYEENLERQVA
ncbi:MAG TPA: hypothetical protein VFE16_04465 [Candidatus Cybelea sp.]|nr:hypothetical protein [Candidatus Cybelea sp.]